MLLGEGLENSGKGLLAIRKICLSLKGLKVLSAPGQREQVAGAVSMMGPREKSAVLLVFPLTLTSSPLLVGLRAVFDGGPIYPC